MTNEELESHFLEYGINEGRVYNSITDRRSFINLLNKEGNVLEIGPLDNPQLDHTSANYYSIDVFDKEQLIQNYINDPNVVKENIIEPSYVIANNNYTIIKEKFTSIFSSHNIEHVPCLVTFLQSLQTLLTDDGSIYFIIPDKRFCFDHFKKETDIYDVLQLYHEKNWRPKFTNVLKQASQITHSNPQEHWNSDHGTVDVATGIMENYERILNQYNTGAYIDTHVSFFTPKAFLDIVNILKRLQLIELEIQSIFHTLRGQLEFFVVLKKAKR
jgi:hypothetical protein